MHKYLSCGLLALVLAACVKFDNDINVDEQAGDVHDIPSNVLVVKFDEDMSAALEAQESGSLKTKSDELNLLLSEKSVLSVKRMFPYAGEYEERTRASGLHRWFVVECVNQASMTKANDIFHEFEGVEFVEILRPIRRTDMSDPFFASQWHYYNDGKLSNFHSSGADINVVPVWEKYTVGSEDVIVAVVDGGIDQDHEDLSLHCIGGYNFAKESTAITADEHGTHVAGTISAQSNNGIGVAGIAGGDAKQNIKGVSLLSCQIFDYDESGKPISADGAAAIKWAADNGAVIAQNSWGFEFSSYAQAKSTPIPRYLRESIDYFITYAGLDSEGNQVGPMKGGVVIFAAGNSSWNTDPIGEYPPVVAVGAIGPDMKRAPYSNYGEWVDIAAPGGNVSIRDGQVLSTLPNNNYGYMQGTSMACPHVSGIAALLVSYFGGQGFTSEELVDKLVGGANPDVLTDMNVGPLADALGSFCYGSDIAPSPVDDLRADVNRNTVNLRWTVSSDEDDGKPNGFLLCMSRRRDDLMNLKPGIAVNGVQIFDHKVNGKKVGDFMTASCTDLKYSQVYYFSIYAYDRSGNYSEMSDILSVRTGGNSAPIIKLESEIENGDLVIGAHDKVELVFSITDSDGGDVNVRVEGNGSHYAFDFMRESSLAYLQIYGNGLLSGTFNVKIIATDESGASAVYPLTYQLCENQFPIMIRPIDDMLIYHLDEIITIDLSGHFEDVDGGEIEYIVKHDNNEALSIDIYGSKLKVLPYDHGVSRVSLMSFDSYGEGHSCEFSIAVKDPSVPVSLYPNPVSDFLNLNVSVADTVRFSLISLRGEVVIDKEMQLSPFNVSRVNLKNIKPGRYKAIVKGKTASVSMDIIKL